MVFETKMTGRGSSEHAEGQSSPDKRRREGRTQKLAKHGVFNVLHSQNIFFGLENDFALRVVRKGIVFRRRIRIS